MESNSRLRRFLMFLRSLPRAITTHSVKDSRHEGEVLLAIERFQDNKSYKRGEGCIIVVSAANTPQPRRENSASLAYSEIQADEYLAIRVGRKNSTICFLDKMGNAFTLENVSKLERQLQSSILSHGLKIEEAPPILPTSDGSTKK